MIDETKDNKTNEIDHATLPENTVTVVIKINGKVYAQGAEVGKITRGMPDEDLDSTLRALRGLGLAMQRRVADLAGKDFDYPLPNAEVEEDDGVAQIMMLADEDIKKGDPVVVDVELGRARNATAEEVELTDEKPDTIAE